MSNPEIAILLNCQTLEEFPVQHTAEDAESLLASWTALWHPGVIAACGRIPPWYRVDTLPPAAPRVLVIPRPLHSSVPPRLATEWEAQGVVPIYAEASRVQILEQILQRLEPTAAEPVLAEDFMALGYAYLQVRLLTRKMRYAVTLEESVLQANLVAGAQAALAGDAEAARRQLQSCFDLLAQERNHYYAVDVFLIDWSLLSAALPKDNLPRQLAQHPKVNLLLSAEQLQLMAERTPEHLAALQSALEARQLTLVGGEYRELPLPLLATSTVRGQLQRGLRVYQQLLQQRPKVFGRHRFGLTPTLPQLLVASGFRAALHATLDGGQFPQATQTKSRWEGDGQTSLHAIVRSPLDASRPETFLNLAGNLGESMDMDHVATRCFAHWAGQASVWYDELLRVGRYTPALGRFVTLDEYFDQTYDPGLHERFGPDQYHSPYLQQSVTAQEPRPISIYPRYWRRWGLLQSLSHGAALALLLHDTPATRAAWHEAAALAEEFAATALDDSWQAREPQLRQNLVEAARHVAQAMAGSTQAAPGLAVVSPHSFARRIVIEDLPLERPVVEQPPVYTADLSSKPRRLVVDVPSMGLTLIAGGSRQRQRRAGTPPLAESTLLRNEFLEAHIDPATGGLRAVGDYGKRGNRMSQQLAYRQDHGHSAASRSDDAAAEPYSTMVGQTCDVMQADSVVGQIKTRGHLQDPTGRVLADFEQTFRLTRGSRVLQLQILLQPKIDPQTDPWRSYFACRFAWPSEVADLERTYHDLRHPTKARRLESPLFVLVDDGAQKTTILTGGLPYHRRVGPRMLDTLLIAGQEVERTFQLGIGLDLKQPLREALGMLLPDTIVPDLAGVTATRSAWLFHLDARNAVINGVQPLIQDDRVAGVRFHVAETDGRSSSVCLRSFRPFRSARKVDAADQTISSCDVVEDQVRFALAAHELTEIEACFQA